MSIIEEKKWLLLSLVLLQLFAVKPGQAKTITIDVNKFSRDNKIESFTEVLRAISATITTKYKIRDTVIINFSSGVYTVKQDEIKIGKKGLEAKKYLSLANIDNIIINGNNAKVKFADGCYFGSFTNENGRLIRTDKIQTSSQFAYNIGYLVDLRNCNNVKITNLHLDGNCSQYKFGGEFGDKGIQCIAYGYFMLGCKNVTIKNSSATQFGTDGLYLGGLNYNCDNFKVENCSFNYNCRQGITLAGSSNITIQKCTLNYTGYYYTSAPASGIDIEAEEGTINNVKVIDCYLKHNSGLGFISYNSFNDIKYSRAIKDIHFKNCTFIAGENYLVEADHNSITFENCTLIGTILNGNRATDYNASLKFFNCTINDNSKEAKHFLQHSLYYNYYIGSKIHFKNTTFSVTDTSSHVTNFMTMQNYPVGISAKDTNRFTLLEKCSFIGKSNYLFQGDYYCTLIKGVQFSDKNEISLNPKFKPKNKAHIYLDHSVFQNNAQLNLTGSFGRLILRESCNMYSSNLEGASIKVGSGMELMINECDFNIGEKCTILIQPGATLTILGNTKLNGKGKIIISAGATANINGYQNSSVIKRL